MKICSGERRRWCVSFMAAVCAHLAVTLYLTWHAVEVEPAGLPLELEMVELELDSGPAPEVRMNKAAPEMAKADVQEQKEAPKPEPVIEPVREEKARPVPDVVETPVAKSPEVPHVAPEPAPVAFEAVAEAAVPPAPAPVVQASQQPQDETEIRPAAAQAAVSKGIDRFEAMLLAHLEKNKRYPREARLRRQEGVVYLRFAMGRHGNVLSLKIEKSSGISALDHESLALVRRSVPLPALPAEFHAERLELVVPVYFSLR